MPAELGFATESMAMVLFSGFAHSLKWEYMMVCKVLVTGGTGFVGGAVLRSLIRQEGYSAVAAVHSPGSLLPEEVSVVPVGDLSSSTDWGVALDGVDVVVHCAARAHVMKETAADPLALYREVNVKGSVALAHQAAAAGVRRFVFLSSIAAEVQHAALLSLIKDKEKVTQSDYPFVLDEKLWLKDPYGASKYDAEQELNQISTQTGMELVIIRPPLVYGPEAKGNFLSMLRWLDKGVPLPLGSVHNRRSLVGIDNLISLILTCITHPAAPYQTFSVSDGEDLSTTELLHRMGLFLGKPARLIPIPESLLQLVAGAIGKKKLARKLLGSLQVDVSKTREQLNWNPPLSVNDGLRKTAEWYLQSRNR